MTALQLTQIGDAVGVILPADLLKKLNLRQGDLLYVLDTSEGPALAPHTAHTAEPPTHLDAQLTAGRDFMEEFAETFHALAK